MLTCLFRVIELGLFENPDIYSSSMFEKGKLILLPAHLYDTANYKNYWLGEYLWSEMSLCSLPFVSSSFKSELYKFIGAVYFFKYIDRLLLCFFLQESACCCQCWKNKLWTLCYWAQTNKMISCNLYFTLWRKKHLVTSFGAEIKTVHSSFFICRKFLVKFFVV